MNKKRLFAIILFIVLGLFMFTFANPRNNKDNKKANGDILTPVEQTNEKEPDVTSNEEQEIITTPVVNDNQIIFNRQPVNTQNRETAVVPTVDLTKNKQAAIDELNNYKKDYEFTDDTDYKKIIDEYTDKINNSDSKDDINKNLEDGKDVIDKLIEDDLNQYKEKAKEEVHKYASDLDFVIDISSLITEIDTQIDNQTTKEAIDKVVEEAKDILDNLLKAAKEEAISQLEDYKKDYPFNEQNKETRRELVEEGINNINDATTVRKVLDKLKEAIEKIDKLIDEDLNEYKEASKGKIDQHYKADDYSKENQGKIEEIIEKAKEEIDKKGINEDNTATIKEEIDKIVEDAKDLIDAIPDLENTLFTVKFLDKMGKVLKEGKVKYNTSAEAPVEVPNVVYKGVTYKFEKWDTDYSNITDDLTVKAEYTITEATVKIFVLKDGVEIPENGKGLAGSNYEQLGTSTLKLTDEIIAAAFGDKNQTIISLDDEEIRSLINKELPLYVENKEGYIYKFYVLKLAEEAFHIDAAIVKDPLYEVRKELSDLLDADYSKYQNIKTSETYNNLINKVEENEKYRESRNEEELNGAIADIKNAINGLVDIKLEGIELDNVPSGNYFVGDQDDTSSITVKAIYNDSNRNRVLGEDEYTKDKTFDSSASGTYTITYSYEGKQATYTYTVTDIVLERIEVTPNDEEYYLSDNMQRNAITVKGYYNDTRLNGRELSENEYTVEEFQTSIGSHSLTVTANGTNVTAQYRYTVKYTAAQIKEKVNKINPYVDWHLEYKQTSWWPHITYISGVGFTLELGNLDEDVNAVYVHKTTQNFFENNDEVITLTKTDKHGVYSVNSDDYFKIWGNNTFIAGQHVYITYKIDSVDELQTVEYTESGGVLHNTAK